jgi:hypothetical protein
MEQQQEQIQGWSYGGIGPERYNKTRQIWQAYIKSEVLSGTLSYGNVVIPLRKNRISFYRRANTEVVDIWHNFSYMDDQNEMYHGRWYNTEADLNTIQVLPNNTFTYFYEGYELNEDAHEDDDDRYVDATFTLVLSPKFAGQVRSLAQQQPQPLPTLPVATQVPQIAVE